MRTIDAHHHFWNYNAEEFSWLSDEMATLRRNYTPEELKTQMAESGVDGVISVEARSTLNENDFLLGIAATNPWVLGVVGKTPLIQGESAVREHLATLLPQPKLVGVRDVLQGEPDGFTTDNAFNTGLSVLKDFDLGFDLCIVERQLAEIIELVDRHLDQIFVLDHIAKPRIKDSCIEPWATHIRNLADRPHVYCKLSGMVTEADWAQWTVQDLEPYMDVALEAFKPDRLMFGTDWPVCRLGCEYGQWVSVVKAFAAQLSAAEQSALFGETATKAYQLEPDLT